MAPQIPDPHDFLKLCKEFAEREERDPKYKIYRVAKHLIERHWGNAEEMANGVTVFLIAWKSHPYRYGSYDYVQLRECISRHIKILGAYHIREIASFSDFDPEYVGLLFDDFLTALAEDAPRGNSGPNPKAVSLALHILCPRFFPLWDDKIARYYVGGTGNEPAVKYIEFCRLAKNITVALQNDVEVGLCAADQNKPLLKLFDEYNYLKFGEDDAA